jgi:hypothetical protein
LIAFEHTDLNSIWQFTIVTSQDFWCETACREAAVDDRPNMAELLQSTFNAASVSNVFYSRH